ncbi:MAG: TIGR01906 family membrane protein [Anaerolineae bacterium]|nr:TIGR01906 family membrane protein [Anaerolineae bacterium]
MGWRSRVLSVLVSLALPVVFLAVALRVVTAPWLVRWEYRKPDFPPDPYGLTTEERIRLAEVCVEYLVTNARIELLADLELEGRPAFNERELAHMVDVQRVFWAILRAGMVAGVVVLGGMVGLLARRTTWPLAASALRGGAVLTLALLAAVVALMLTSWEVFFTGFHELFFPPDTWTFPTSDTLIRLYPERFWMDVGIAIVGVVLIQANLVLAAAFALQTIRPAQ